MASKPAQLRSRVRPSDFSPEIASQLEHMAAPHIESFNFFLGDGLKLAITDLEDVMFECEKGKMEWSVEDLKILKPSGGKSSDVKMYPSECRQSHSTYGAPAIVRIRLVLTTEEGAQEFILTRGIGHVPIMVRSSHCHLYGMTPAQLVAHHEEQSEVGGYFIINGNEKMLRMLSLIRRNDPHAIIRPSFKRIGGVYSKYGIMIRCVKEDQTAQTITLHYLTDGNCNVRFILNRTEFLIPAVILLKAFIDSSDQEIFHKATSGYMGQQSFITDHVELLLRLTKPFKLYTKEQCLAYIGARFRVALRNTKLKDLTDAEVGQYLLNKHFFIHLQSDQDKFELLILMLRKLLLFVKGDVEQDNMDSPMNQEILLPGHLFLSLLKERIQEACYAIRYELMQAMRMAQRAQNAADNNNNNADDNDNTNTNSSSSSSNRRGRGVKFNEELFKKVAEKHFSGIGSRLANVLATGNINSKSGLDLMQGSGFTVVADKLNYIRWMAHFVSVHRGAFFATMRTTEVRKLLPEAWGFFCPVHTPDGAPCGLLNHLTSACKVVTQTDSADASLASLFGSLGVTALSSSTIGSASSTSDYLPVVLNGRVLGSIAPQLAPSFAQNLRYLKANGLKKVPWHLEIAYVPPKVDSSGKGTAGGKFPGIFLFSTPSRLMRPVNHLATSKTEYIGSLEQVYLHVACLPSDIKPHVTTHTEIDLTSILSFVANLTPFSDFNQSPRNMYQCQMAKQTIGTPMHSFTRRTDNKIYRIQTPQKPIVRTKDQIGFHVNEYPHGANAIVAVISYTGYDMEDAMIINKSSYERGFAHGFVYKTEVVKLQTGRMRANRKYFANIIPSTGQKFCPELDDDGLPETGSKLNEGTPFYCIYDEESEAFRVTKYKSSEEATVDEIRIIGGAGGVQSENHIQNVSIKLRLDRRPVIGDKFASRHGQKGVLSRLWPLQDMPFSESGMTPDLIINPHAFPSRMTIGMLIESMAGKSGALHGIFHDSSPFRFDEKNTAVNYFGEQLLKAGYNYYGNEPLYSGILGTEFYADIFLGNVYYQRLRHMVKDKYQVRSTGPINAITKQPVKGRKVGGGLRFGEMERDSLLAHGVSFMLHDRLQNCSDLQKGLICTRCGSILTPTSATRAQSTTSFGASVRNQMLNTNTCQSCSVVYSDYNPQREIENIYYPYVLKYLATELQAMNIRLAFTLKPQPV